MKEYKRVFVIVIDSLGIGAMPDGEKFGDVGVNFWIPTLQKLGMANLTPLRQVPAVENPLGYQAALRERSNGKDTMTGHWEIMGIETKKPFGRRRDCHRTYDRLYFCGFCAPDLRE